MTDEWFRVGGAPQDMLPFQTQLDGAVWLVGRPDCSIDYGIVYDCTRGHRVFFSYSDSPECKNTWGWESLRKWNNSWKATTEEERVFQIIIRQQIALAADLDRQWIAAGRPIEGIGGPKETMQ